MSAGAANDQPHEAQRNDLLALMIALLKIALVGDGAEITQWRAQAIDAQHRLAESPGAATALHLDDIWILAVKTAERDPVVERDETVNPMLPMVSPIGLDQLTASSFDLDGVVQTIRDVASFG